MQTRSIWSRLAQAGFVAAALGAAQAASAQITLSAGDVAVIGRINNGSPDAFTFVALADISAGSIIYFTDNGWFTAGGFRGVTDADADGSENLIKFTANNTIVAGTIISSTSTSADWTWTTTGSIPGGTSGSFLALSFNQSGDTFYALQSNSASDPLFITSNTFQFLYAFDDTNNFENPYSSPGDTSNGGLPPGVTVGSGATSVNFTTGGTIAFNTGALSSGTKADWLLAIGNALNWSSVGSLPSGTINVVPAVNPSVTGVSFLGGPVFTGGGTATFEVTLSGPPIVSPATVQITSSAFVAPINVNISAPNTTGTAIATLVNPVATPIAATASASATANATGGGTTATFNVFPAASASLSPSVQSTLPGGMHTVTATVFNGANVVGAGINVNFQVISGPNMGASGSSPTNGSGQASFTYASNGQAGQDVITASGTLSGNPFSVSAVRNWVNNTPVYLTEIYTNAPGGGDQGAESVEIQGNVARTMAGFYFVVIEGDNTPSGTVDKVIDLGALATGANGLLLLRDTADVLDPAPDADTTVHVMDFDPDIENDGNTFILGWGTPPEVGVDLDVDGNGALDAGALTGFTVVDAVAFYDGDNGGNLYADEFGALGVNLPQDPPNPATGWTPDSVVRILSPDGTPCSWAGADVAGGFPGPYTYAVNEQLGFAPVGYVFIGALSVSPGVPNLQSPVINNAPSAQTVNANDPVTFTVSGIATGFQWRRNGMNLTDGGNISGATTNTLQIASATGANAGNYDVVLTSPCGSVTTTAVALTVNGGTPTPCEIADFDGMNGVDVVDLFAFLDAWFAETGVCVSSCSSDISAPSGSPDVTDLFDYLDLWFFWQGTNPCP